MLAEAIKPKVVEIATGIYTRLVGDAVSVSEKGVAMKVDPASLAKLSFKLAAVFQQVEDEINTDALPKNAGYKLDSADIASWSK